MMSVYKLVSENFYIRTLHVNEVTHTYVDWLNDPEVNEFLEVKYTTWTLESCRRFVAEFQDSKIKYIFGIYDRKKNTHIGNGSVSEINVNTGTFTLALFIGNKEYWGGSAGREATLLLLKFGFDHLGLRKFFGGAYSNQLASRLILRKIGAIEEAKLREKAMFRGHPVDTIVYSVDRESWKMIRQKFNLEDQCYSFQHSVK